MAIAIIQGDGDALKGDSHMIFWLSEAKEPKSAPHISAKAKSAFGNDVFGSTLSVMKTIINAMLIIFITILSSTATSTESRTGSGRHSIDMFKMEFMLRIGENMNL